MSTEVIYTLREDKQEIQKQLGCMNGIFQLFDRRYLLGQRRHGHHHKKLPKGQNESGKEFNNVSEKQKEKTANYAVKEKHRVSVESSRNSVSSSCSSLDCSKRVQTEVSSSLPSIISEPSSPTSQKKQVFSVQTADIRDVVKDSMTRKPRVVSVKPVSKDERKGPAMTHVDSPRPLPHPKPVPYERKDQNLAKLREIAVSGAVKKVKETSRFSYDGRESPYKLKSIAYIKERPRLSLDSKQSSIKTCTNVADQSQTHEPGSNKKPSSSVVARLMGLEVLNDFINGGETLKIKSSLDDDLISVSRFSRKAEESKTSPRAPNALTRIPLEPAPWRQEKGSRGFKKQPPSKKARERAGHGCQSVYGQIEQRLTEVEFKKSGKDLRALKQILEAIQRTKMRLENMEQNKSVQSVSPTIKVKPDNLSSDSMVITNLQKVNSGGRCTRNLIPTEKKATGRTKKPVSPSHTSAYLTGRNYCNSINSGTVSPRLQKSKNGSDKQSIHGIRKQSNRQLTASNSKTRDQLCRYSRNIRNSSQEGETVSYPSESDASVVTQNEQEVTSNDWSQENKNKFVERLMGYKPTAELAMLTMEQPSPVSVLDAFYTEESPSPIKKKSYCFRDDEDLCLDEQEWSQVGINDLVSSTHLNHSTSGFNHIKLENVKNLVHQIELLHSTSDEVTVNSQEGMNGDHIYIKEILLASGLLNNLDCTIAVVRFPPTGSLINPELFNILEKTKECTSKSQKIKRKLIFDTVNNILVQKLARSASSGLWTSKRKGRILTGEKLLEELCLEINNLQSPNKAGDVYDEIINIITEDVNKKSEDWDDNSNEVPALVLDIERLIFKDLINEVVNAEVSGPLGGHGRHRRQLFLM